MSSKICVSVIVPFYNAELHIMNCVNSLLNQDFQKTFEMIMVDDASTDKSQEIIKKLDSPIIKLHKINFNSGPSAARNVGLKASQGEYIFFLDVDDTIDSSTLKILYNDAKENSFDLIFCDKKRVENSKNKREKIFIYHSDKVFNSSDIIEEIKQRISIPSHTNGVVGLHGKLIKRSVLSENNLVFNEKLRFFEDEMLMFDILACVKNMKYIHKQLYTYNINHNVKSARSEAFNRPFPLTYFKLIKTHVQKSFLKRGLSLLESEKLGDQALIFWIIYTLLSYSLSIAKGKEDLKNGTRNIKKIINDLIQDHEVSKAIKNYSISKEESPWIPRAIAWRLSWLFEFALKKRAMQIIKKNK